ncbi:MAG TPA: C4-dicarboxylate ABC transporter permease [Spirochaetaceae bacterium]|nr:C4-dicarboxylate ABC transporter permease [Spirochaetaceae bacterium]
MRMRPESNKLKLPITIIASLFGLFYFYTSGFGVLSSQSNTGLFMLFTFMLCFLLYPASQKRPGSKPLMALDAVLFLLSIAAILYWVFQYPTYAAKRVGIPNNFDIGFGIIMIVLSLEVTRRAMGNTLMILGFLMLAQVYLGPWLPGIFEHGGISISRLVEYNYFIDGIFGTIVTVYATYVMPFLLFGAFLQTSGAGDFFIDLASSLAGRIPGGPALVSVIGSAIFGSISGSPVANVVATGTFTIPMMKRVGYTKEFAGAVEAAASTGGSFLPPVMGAAAFVLATITETPYGTVMIMAVLPALLYYLSIGIQVYFQARRSGLKGLEAHEVPKARDVLKRGWYFLISIIAVGVLIAGGYSPPVIAFGGSVFVIVCNLLFGAKSEKFTVKKFIASLESAGTSSLIVGSTAGTLGLVMSGMTLTGLGLKFSSVLVAVAGSHLFLMILMVMLIATIVGMGTTITASYIILSILAAPSLIMAGVPPINAHLLCFWLSMSSNLTPPVCVAAFAAASISGGDPMKTGFHSFLLGIFMYLMPFAFVYVPQIMIVGYSFPEIAEVVISYGFATVALAATVQGWLMRRLDILQRAICLVGCILLATPELVTDLIGLALLAAVFLFNFWKRGKDGSSGKVVTA